MSKKTTRELAVGDKVKWNLKEFPDTIWTIIEINYGLARLRHYYKIDGVQGEFPATPLDWPPLSELIPVD